jgi:archaemetzincin
MNKAIATLKPKDAFCMIGMSIFDIYPRDAKQSVYGLAFSQIGAGTFALARYSQIHEPDNNDPNRKLDWFRRSTYCMVHELGHLFGLPHCTFYECTMNGVNCP